jgi:hypothetical protein
MTRFIAYQINFANLVLSSGDNCDETAKIFQIVSNTHECLKILGRVIHCSEGNIRGTIQQKGLGVWKIDTYNHTLTLEILKN